MRRLGVCLEERNISVALSQLNFLYQISHWLQWLFAFLSFWWKNNLFYLSSISLRFHKFPGCAHLSDLILLIADKGLLLYPRVKNFWLLLIANLRPHCPEAAYFTLLMMRNCPQIKGKFFIWWLFELLHHFGESTWRAGFTDFWTALSIEDLSEGNRLGSHISNNNVYIISQLTEMSLSLELLLQIKYYCK